jgi:hypothetical protein
MAIGVASSDGEADFLSNKGIDDQILDPVIGLLQKNGLHSKRTHNEF